MPDRRARDPSHLVAAATVALLLTAHAALAVHSLRQESVTVDEFAHLPAGISYWQTGGFATYHHNPPLIKLLAALPVLPAQPQVTYGEEWSSAIQKGYAPSQYAFGVRFMRDNAERYFELFNRGRYLIVAISILGGCFVYLWATQLNGRWAGFLALALWCFCPNVLAHAGLITVDIGAAVFGFIATYFFWLYLKAPTWGRATTAGVLLGLAQLTKYTLLPLYVVWPGLYLVWRLKQRRVASATGPSAAAAAETRSVPGRLVAAHACVMLLLSLLVVNAGYGLEGTFRPLGRFEFLSRWLTRPRTSGRAVEAAAPLQRQLYARRQNRFQGTWLQGLGVPLPAEYLLGFDELSFEAESSADVGERYQAYLRGELRGRGWWYYYLYALLVKLPLGTGALVALWLAVGSVRTIRLLRHGPRALLWDPIVEAAVVWLPALSFLAVVSSQTAINLGVRYALPVLPFVFVGISSLLKEPRSRCWHAEAPVTQQVEREQAARELGTTAPGPGARIQHVLKACALVAVAWNLYSGVVKMHPHYLSYFNELVGGPERGGFHLIDSNIDWGQDLIQLRRWMNRHAQRRPIGLAYFGSIDPKLAGIDDSYVPPLGVCRYTRQRGYPPHALGPMPGLYAISVNIERGMETPGPPSLSEDGVAYFPTHGLSYFRYFTPVGRAGYSILIYDISLEDANRVRREYGLPRLSLEAPVQRSRP